MTTGDWSITYFDLQTGYPCESFILTESDVVVDQNEVLGKYSQLQKDALGDT